MENTAPDIEQEKELKAHVVSFRLTDFQYGCLQTFARKYGRTVPDMARFMCVNTTSKQAPAPIKSRANKPRLTPTASIQELSKISAQLSKIGGNINQLARKANTFSELPTASSLAKLHNQVTDMQAQIQKTLRGVAS